VRRTAFTGAKKHTREKRLNTCKRKTHVKIDLIPVQYDYSHNIIETLMRLLSNEQSQPDHAAKNTCGCNILYLRLQHRCNTPPPWRGS